ncbi:Myb-like protein O [Carex littledalei]|uniref:Myb-like protein O n=1 Tax=Carex littledalei TaxID=544730 RepID=A0A833R6C0_9POAL|nr:Myb-like protein O [Carex littledalei]
MEPEEVEEEEDLDFVPFLREDIPSDDGSSGVTSENEGAGPTLIESPLDENNMDNSLAAGLSGPVGPTTGLSKEEEEEAICKRTRARFSLENYSLDELEVFLQESDEDAEGQNVDEEEEYRRFLTAVLTDELPYNTEEVGVADEDENDADFELEIEEALESDPDEPVDNIVNEAGDKSGGAHRRPETRQKKRMKESYSDNHQSDLLTKTALLRPLVPYLPPGQATTLSGPTVPGQLFGFTAQQIGQLYVMLHEHVQLLVQVFSVSVLDPARQQYATETQNLLKEMVVKREEALTGKAVAFPGSCFAAQNLYSSTSGSVNGRHESASWMPIIDGPIYSVLDVMPLRLAKDYLEDVTASVVRYKRSHLESTTDKSYTKREPLFPLPTSRSKTADNGSHTDKGQKQPKKTLAATLVEDSMKQTVALVPADIAKNAKRFYSLFNLEMLPHKPPVSAVAKRVLFTDAEDRLLAMGLMDYNNDWEAIQKHYLPCKSKHQIFVRQKNRNSSKAPDNPIKAVRHMKTSPLGPDEIMQIQEGLKLYKNDWSLVWKLVVPHRDPALLPRQWRVAMGTQKSYAKSEVTREKRRRYEAKRRRKRALMADSKDLNTEEENEMDEGLNGEYENDNNAYEEEAYVHEAFLADSEQRNDTNSSIPQQGTGPSISNPNNPSQTLTPLNSRLSKYNSPTVRSFLPLPNRRKKGYRLVKLAPELPPVNLPPSVRIISRARFNISQTPATKDTSSSIVELPKQLDLFPDSTQNNNSQTEADFQMHPLLFQMTPDQQLSLYRPIATHPMNDSSSSGFRGFSKEIPGDSVTLAFHPLLQRISTDEGLDSQRNCSGERQRVHNNLDLNIRLYSSPCGPSNNTVIESMDANEDAHLEVANAFSLEQRTLEQVAEHQNGSGYQQSGALIINEDSIQGIVMEQEELSDSDDGGDDSEHVEFEREEMVDSDDDQSPVLESLVALSDKNHQPLKQRDASHLIRNQTNTRGPKQKKESRKDGSMQIKTESRPRKARGRGANVGAQLDTGTSNRPVTAPRKPRKQPVLK